MMLFRINLKNIILTYDDNYKLHVSLKKGSADRPFIDFEDLNAMVNFVNDPHINNYNKNPSIICIK